MEFFFVLVIFMDSECGNIYMMIDFICYLEWDGIYIGWDFFLNFWDGFVIFKDYGSCKVSFEFGGIFSFKVCIIVEEFYIEDCNMIVNYYYYDDFKRKVVSVFLFCLYLLVIKKKLMMYGCVFLSI